MAASRTSLCGAIYDERHPLTKHNEHKAKSAAPVLDCLYQHSGCLDPQPRTAGVTAGIRNVKKCFHRRPPPATFQVLQPARTKPKLKLFILHLALQRLPDSFRFWRILRAVPVNVGRMRPRKSRDPTPAKAQAWKGFSDLLMT